MKSYLIKNILLLSVFFALIFFVFPHKNLYFVDAARYADIARNYVQNGIYTTTFNLAPELAPSEIGWPVKIPRIHILSIALFFKLFGINDSSVIISSIVFFILSAPLVFLIAKKLFGDQVAKFSFLFYLFTPQLINYALDGASEAIFIFELLLISYLIILNKKWSYALSGAVLGFAFFTKIQSFLFAPIFFLWVYLLNKKSLNNIAVFLAAPVLTIILNKIGFFFSDYQLTIPTYLAFQQTSLFPGDNLARSGLANQIDSNFLIKNMKIFLAKFFYNLYNFYKIVFNFDNLLPSWTSPVVVISFLLSQVNFFRKEKYEIRLFRFIVFLMVIASFILAAATSPHIRYAHFVLPLVIILAIDFICNFLGKYNFSPTKSRNILISIFIIFMVIPFAGKIALDKRFNDKQYNVEKPFAQKVLGRKIGELTGKNDIVVSNLDTWGSWYGQRKTIMMPLNFQVLEKINSTFLTDAIFLTDFQRENEDHPLKGEWGTMFDNPESVSDKFILDNFKLQEIGTVSAQEVYENKEFIYKLWVKK